MKKYISVAALLAAGTAFANAADTTGSVLVDGKQLEVKNVYEVNKETEEEELVRQEYYVTEEYNTLEGNTLQAEKPVEVINNGTVSSSTTLEGCTLTNNGTLSGTVTGTSVTFGNNGTLSATSYFTGGTFTNYAEGIIDSSCSISLTNSSGLTIYSGSVVNVSSFSTTALFSGSVGYDWVMGEYSVPMAGTLTIQDGLVLDFKDVLTLAKGGEYLFANLTAENGISVNAWGETVSSLADTSVVIKANGVDAGTAMLSWTNTGTNWVGKITVTANPSIPEPSAFGLLAGIGALALVASRRRRK